MKTVTVSKQKLQIIVSENRNKHRAQFEEAFEGYRKECIALLSRNLDDLKSGRKVEVRFYEVAPQDHTGDYDTVLNMLSMSVDDNIELTHQEFQQYVEDDWNWREQWNASNMKYMASR